MIGFLIGMAVGIVLASYIAIRQGRKSKKRYDALIGMAKTELDDAESRIEELHQELVIRQNVIDSQNERINKQLRIINRYKKNGTDNNITE